MAIIPGTDYSVKSGDTLSSIAARAYDDASESSWRRIYNANRVVIGRNPDRLSPGQVIYIPVCDIALGTDYTVRRGDTLSSIAKRAYGDGSETSWRVIYDANQAVFGNNPDRLTPGQVLYIPA